MHAFENGDFTVIISLYGYKGSGKSTAAAFLMQEQEFALTKFAQPLKNFLYDLGLETEHVEGDLKEAPCDLLCGKSPRHAMQTLGTEWGRKCIGEDFWVNVWKDTVQWTLSYDGVHVVVDDMRFPNEAFAVKSLGGVLVRIVRGNRPVDTHESEAHISGIVPDYTIVNNGSTDDLRHALEDLLCKLQGAPEEAAGEPF